MEHRHLCKYNLLITRRRTSRMSLRIAKNGDVRVSVPFNVSKEEVYAFIDKHSEWIERARERLRQKYMTRDSFFAQLPLHTKAEWKVAETKLNGIIEPLVKKYVDIMGVAFPSIFFRATISRWGCCYTTRNAICFSLYLLLLPDLCIEHVVVHELAHLLEPNHSPRFYALMDQYFPRWREIRALTRRISGMEAVGRII